MTTQHGFEDDPLYPLVKRNVAMMPPLSAEKLARLALILNLKESVDAAA